MIYSHSTGMHTPSIKRQRQRQGPIGMHCAAPKSVPDPFPRGNPSGKRHLWSLPLAAGCAHSLRYFVTLSTKLINTKLGWEEEHEEKEYENWVKIKESFTLKNGILNILMNYGKLPWNLYSFLQLVLFV